MNMHQFKQSSPASVRHLSMKRNPQRQWVLWCAAGAALGMATIFVQPAAAQQRVGGDGRVNDANNRVGSGGFNDTSASALPPGVFGNSIVTGNVTGGAGFRGNVGYRDPTSFSNILPGQGIDNFVSQSSGVSTGGVLSNNANQVHLYLGDSRGVNPSANFVSLGNNGGYVPVQNVGGQSIGDGRLGTIQSSTGGLGGTQQSLFLPAGTTAGSGTSAYISASTLFGVQKLSAQQQTIGQQPTVPGQAAGLNGQPLDATIGGSRLDATAEARLEGQQSGQNTDLTPLSAIAGSDTDFNSARGQQGGLPNTLAPTGASSLINGSTSPNGSPANSAAPNANGNGTNNGANADNTIGGLQALNAINGGAAGNGNGNGTGNNGGNNAAGGPINNQTNVGPISSAVASGVSLNGSPNGSALGGSVNTGADVNTIALRANSTTAGSGYLLMLRNFAMQNGNAPLNAVQRNLLYQRQVADLKAADAQKNAGKEQPAKENPRGLAPDGSGASAAGTLGRGGPSGAGSSPMAPTAAPTEVPLVPSQINGGKMKPISIPSFSKDEPEKGTAQLLAKAEDFMKQGKFTSALEQYDLVEQTAPNNPFALLGRANAELGASYYGLADSHLRQAFSANQALLMAQYDLKQFFGVDRLQYLVTDLKQIAQANPTQARPVFLLAYIYYNTNDVRRAAAYLDLAEKREGKADDFFKLLRQNWDLPNVSGDKSGADLNK